MPELAQIQKTDNTILLRDEPLEKNFSKISNELWQTVSPNALKLYMLFFQKRNAKQENGEDWVDMKGYYKYHFKKQGGGDYLKAIRELKSKGWLLQVRVPSGIRGRFFWIYKLYLHPQSSLKGYVSATRQGRIISMGGTKLPKDVELYLPSDICDKIRELNIKHTQYWQENDTIQHTECASSIPNKPVYEAEKLSVVADCSKDTEEFGEITEITVSQSDEESVDDFECDDDFFSALNDLKLEGITEKAEPKKCTNTDLQIRKNRVKESIVYAFNLSCRGLDKNRKTTYALVKSALINSLNDDTLKYNQKPLAMFEWLECLELNSPTQLMLICDRIVRKGWNNIKSPINYLVAAICNNATKQLNRKK